VVSQTKIQGNEIMKAETPAQGIMKTHDFGDSLMYTVACSCGDSTHDINFNVEVNDGGEITVNTYVETKSDYWSQTFVKRYDIDNIWLQEVDWVWKDLINGLITRAKLTWSLWTKGYVRTESTVIMSEQQALNYAETLKTAIKDLETFEAKRNGDS
jgi:hypothetical protein